MSLCLINQMRNAKRLRLFKSAFYRELCDCLRKFAANILIELKQYLLCCLFIIVIFPLAESAEFNNLFSIGMHFIFMNSRT